MDYTPRYDRGAPSAFGSQLIADPTETYHAVSVFYGTDVDAETYRAMPFYVPGSNMTQTTTVLPRASQITLLANQGAFGTASPFASGFEVLVVSQDGLALPVGVAWLNGFTAFPETGKWFMTLTGIDSPCSIFAKSGIKSGDAGVSQLDIFAYLQNGAAPTRDRVSPYASVPPFGEEDDYLFSNFAQEANRPAKQVLQNQREYFGVRRIFSLPDATLYRMNIFGGPWIGQMAFDTDISTATAELRGMDLFTDQLDTGYPTGYLIDSVTSNNGLLKIEEPLRYDWLQLSIDAEANQTIRYRIALTSPTR